MSMKRKRLLIALLLFVLGLIATAFVVADRARAPEDESDTTNEIQSQETAASNGDNESDKDSLDRNQNSIDEPGSIWWIVNRERPLPDGYVPPRLTVPNVRLRLDSSEEQMQFRQIATPAVEEMFAAAQADGIELVFGSGYRSESLQRQFYQSYVARDGQEAADRYSARPGTSEHQTGLAFDVTTPNLNCHLEICFEDTAQGQWVRDNAHRYGFIIRYLENKEDVTGYQYEPWHLRYVGEELATKLYETGQTMEEFFDIVSYYPPVLAMARLSGCTCCC